MSIRELDEWDPMKEDHSSEANSYNTGPGATLPKEYQPRYQRQNGRKSKLKLHVTNLPENFDEEIMKNIFVKYGTIKELFINQNHLFAGVTYAEERSAHEALTALRSDPVYSLKIGYWNEKDKTTPDNMQKRSQHRNNGFVSNFSKSPLVGSNSENDSFSRRIQSSSFTGSQTYVHYVSKEESMRTCTTMVSYKSSVAQSEEPQMSTLPTCAHCGKRTFEQCQKCRVYYCTKKCMVFGFEHHKFDTCIIIAPHSLDPELKETRSEKSNSVSTVRPIKDTSRLNQIQPHEMMDAFQADAKDYLRHATTSLTKNYESLKISNSYDDDDSTKQKNPMKDDFVAKKRHSVTGEDLVDEGGSYDRNAGMRSGSGYQKERDNYRKKDDESRRSYNAASNGDNQVPKTNSRIRNDGNQNRNDDHGSRKDSYGSRNDNYTSRSDNSGSRNDNYGNRNDRNYNTTPNARRFDNSRNDGNRSSDFVPRRADRMDSSRGERQNDEYGRKGFSESNDVKPENRDRNEGSKNDRNHDSSAVNEERIEFSSSPPKFGEKKSYQNLDNSSRSNNYYRDEKREDKQKPEVPKSPEYQTKRKLYEEGEILEVRLCEITSNPPVYSSVKIVEEESLFRMLSADLMKEMNFPPINDTKCVVYRDNGWLRASIASSDPFRVKYIDLGYKVYECEETSAKGCPEKYASIRPFAYKVKFLNSEKVDLNRLKKEDEVFKIMIKKKVKDLVWDVEIVLPDYNEQLKESRLVRDSKLNCQLSSNAKKEAKSIFQPGISLKVYVTYIEENGGIFYVARSEDIRNIVNEVQNHVMNSPKLEQIGKNKLCLASQEGAWYRAEIIDTNPLSVYFLDFGNTARVAESDLKEMPAVCQAIEPLAVKVKLEDGKTTDFGIVEYDEHCLMPIARNVEKKLWTVTSEECLRVMVTHLNSKNECYVIRERDTSLMEKIEALQFIPLKLAPKVGSTYLIRYEGSNARAELVKGSPLTVNFIDFGNDEIIEDDQFGELPAEWQKKEPLAFKIFIVPESVKSPLELYSKILIREKEPNKWLIVKHFPN